MKRILTIIFLALLCLTEASAVLKEKNLEETLSILREELTAYNEELASRNDEARQINDQVHQRLMSIYRESNKNALMLYTQKEDYVFDLTYACHEATELYEQFQRQQIPFRSYLAQTEKEIARYDSIIVSLRSMPVSILTRQAKKDRDECLSLALGIHGMLESYHDGINKYIKIYDTTEQRLKNINDYANKRYDDLQTSIFKNGGDDYFTILLNFGTNFEKLRSTIANKYRFSGEIQSQWDSRFIIGLFAFILFYAMIASLLNIVGLRFLVPQRFRTPDFIAKRSYITMATSTVTFAIITSIVAHTFQQNFFLMASGLLVEYAWLLGVILISLLLRVDASQLGSAFRIYSPLLAMGFIVISFRIILVPNELVNMVLPPLLLACALWQWVYIRHHNRNIPRSDMFYTYMSLIVFASSVGLSWGGYTLFSVQLLIWWIMQLTCILTITCLSGWIKKYGEKRGYAALPVTKTWAYNLMYEVVRPVFALVSIPISIYWAADVFNLSSLCWELFTHNIVDIEETMRVSLMRIIVVIALWSIFSYICSTARQLLRIHFETEDPTTAESRSMMGKNVIQVFIWGTWFLMSLSILGISFTWLVVVSGGLSTGIGFASKDIIENIYYGISLMAGRIKVGDIIECDGVKGKVASISYTSTLIEALDGSVIAFQNSQLFTKNYKNLTRNHGYVLSTTVFGVAYGADIKKVIAITEEAVSKLKTPNIDRKRKPKAIFIDMADSSLNFKMCVWVNALKLSHAESDIKTAIYNVLNENGIEIPFPQLDVHFDKQ